MSASTGFRAFDELAQRRAVTTMSIGSTLDAVEHTARAAGCDRDGVARAIESACDSLALVVQGQRQMRLESLR